MLSLYFIVTYFTYIVITVKANDFSAHLRSADRGGVAQADFTADSPSLAGNSVSTELLFRVLAALYICLFQPHSFPIGKSLSFLFPKMGACSPSFSSVC